VIRRLAPYIVDAARSVIGKVPVFGICLGHQILARRLAAILKNSKFGHHGINQPVKKCGYRTRRNHFQNHGFVVVPASVGSKAKKTYHNLNDSTSEGMQMPLTMSVQYHPEASPGPHDTEYLFLAFGRNNEKKKGKTK